MQNSNQKEKAARTHRTWQGLGIWNVYFILKFALASFGYLNLDILYNALLLVFLLIPLDNRRLHVLREAVAVVAGLALVYSESWLPGIDSFLSNKNAIAGFSLTYVLQFLLDFINFKMIGWGVLVLVLYFLLRRYVRISFFTIAYFLVMIAMPFVDSFGTAEQTTVAAEEEEGEAGADKPADSKTLEEWYSAFINYEKERHAFLPQTIGEKDTPFDILILSICSLSNDDLAAVKLDSHPVLNEFNIRFDKFNSASSYSGPAVLRLLKGACGQPSHQDLYGERRTECELLNRLSQYGYRQRLLMDHAGEYDNFVQQLRDKAGLEPELETLNKPFPVRYMAFDDEPISDDLSVLRYWQKTTLRSKEPRTVTLMNFISLHDGNRLPRHGRAEEFKPRAQQLLDDLQTFMNELDKSGRRVMLVVVPEHGAAVRGDKVQAPKLRDIPSLRITEVPAMVRFFGIKGLPDAPIHVSSATSYLAMTSLIGKVLEKNYYGKPEGTVPLEELVTGLPQTNVVSENGQAKTLEYKGREYIRQNTAPWRLYAK
jgi:cellulose synthase operon protein YhjU